MMSLYCTWCFVTVASSSYPIQVSAYPKTSGKKTFKGLWSLTSGIPLKPVRRNITFNWEESECFWESTFIQGITKYFCNYDIKVLRPRRIEVMVELNSRGLLPAIDSFVDNEFEDINWIVQNLIDFEKPRKRLCSGSKVKIE